MGEALLASLIVDGPRANQYLELGGDLRDHFLKIEKGFLSDDPEPLLFAQLRSCTKFLFDIIDDELREASGAFVAIGNL